LKPWRHRICFQFTIGTTNSALMKVIEPGAPRLKERIKSLRAAFHAGFTTSVGCTPALDRNVKDTYNMVKPWTTLNFHIGAVDFLGAHFNNSYGLPTEGKLDIRKLSPAALGWIKYYEETFSRQWAEEALLFASSRNNILCESQIHEICKKAGNNKDLRFSKYLGNNKNLGGLK